MDLLGRLEEVRGIFRPSWGWGDTCGAEMGDARSTRAPPHPLPAAVQTGSQEGVCHGGALDPAGGTCVYFDKHLVTEVESAFNVGDSDLYLKVGWCSQVAGGCVSEPLKSPHEGGATRVALGQPRESLKIWDRASALLKGNSGGDPA